MSEGRTPEEQRFLTRIAGLLGRSPLTSPPDQPVRGVPQEWASPDFDRREAAERFVNNWRALGGEAEMIVGSQAADKAAEILAGLQGRRVVRWNDPLLEELGLDEALRRGGASVYVWRAGASREEALKAAEQADLGITGVHWAVAEPGTVVLLSGGNSPRSVSLLPPAYLAIVPLSRLVPSLTYVMREVARRGLPSSLNFITGPSRTADIENDLTIGVHGPGKVYALVLEDC